MLWDNYTRGNIFADLYHWCSKLLQHVCHIFLSLTNQKSSQLGLDKDNFQQKPIKGKMLNSKGMKQTSWYTCSKWQVLSYMYSNKNFILKYFRCRDGKRTETRIGMEGICITHSCIPLYTVYMQHIMAHSGGMQEWVIQIPSIPILVSVLFPSLHLKYFRIKFLLLVCIVFMRMRTKPHPHPVISEATPTSSYKKGLEVLAVFALVCTFPAFS